MTLRPFWKKQRRSKANAVRLQFRRTPGTLKFYVALRRYLHWRGTNRFGHRN